MWGAAAPLLLVLLWSGAAAAPNGPHVGWDCLRQTTPAVALRYPADALEHFEAIHRRLARFAGPLHMGGPGVKNVWVYDALRRLRYGRWRGTGHFRNDWIATVETRGPRRELRDVFGPFIPLLVTWTDVWLSGGRWRYPAGFAAEVRGVLRPDVPYVTVNQNDEGIGGKCELLMSDLPNVLVFSSGGYGHVPVPLYHQPEKGPEDKKPFAERQYLVSFVGTPRGPRNFRDRMSAVVHSAAQAHGFEVFTGHSDTRWRTIMHDSVASLVLRGFGRSAFKLVETIQRGHIPVCVYSDVPWVPYEDVFLKFGYVTNLTFLGSVLEELRRTAAHNQWSVLEEREAAARAHARSHFTPGAISDQIFRFLSGRDTDLRCAPLPPTPVDEGPCGAEAVRAGPRPPLPSCLNGSGARAAQGP